MKAKHVQTGMHPDSDNRTKVKHHASALVCHYLIERFVLGLNAAISITVTLKKKKKEKINTSTMGMKTGWETADMLRQRLIPRAC